MVALNQGDIIDMNFTPQKGHEQSGRRPALIISNNVLNHHSSMAMVCPITSTNKHHPFHLELDERTDTTGVILCDQAKLLDIRARNAKFREKCPDDIWNEVKYMVISFL